MRIELTNAGCTLYREPSDRKIYKENQVTHAMKTLLIAQGITAHRMRGNVGLTSCTQVLRLPALKATLWHELYQIEDAAQAFNAGEVFYQRVDDEERTDYEAQVIDYPLRAEMAASH